MTADAVKQEEGPEHPSGVSKNKGVDAGDLPPVRLRFVGDHVVPAGRGDDVEECRLARFRLDAQASEREQGNKEGYDPFRGDV